MIKSDVALIVNSLKTSGKNIEHIESRTFKNNWVYSSTDLNYFLETKSKLRIYYVCIATQNEEGWRTVTKLEYQK